MPPEKPAGDSYILGDWGTSHLRLYLMNGDEIVARRDGPGIAAFGAAPAAANVVTPALALSLLEQTASWRESMQSREVLLAGMAGSRNGLAEVPYASVPTDRDAWARAAWSKHLPEMQLTIATGLQYRGDHHGDVMRGEETQIFGAMHLQPQFASGSHVFVLPGTHSKWVDVQDGTIARFTTAMTGEIYALLRDHSTLLKVAHATPDADAEVEAGFDAGVARSAELIDGLLAAVFRVRTAQLLDQRSYSWARGFLSGLLIGSEVASLSCLYATAGNVCIVGESELTALYRRVFARRGISVACLDGAACVVAGLRVLRQALRTPS